MKKLILFIFITLILLSSCDMTFRDNRESTNYQGLYVKLKEGVPSEALYYEQTDLENILFKSNSPFISKGVNTSEPKIEISISELNNESEDIFKNYPNFNLLFNGNNEEKEQQFQIIRFDFPNLTDLDIEENIDEIEEIYNRQSAFQIVSKLSLENNNYISKEISQKDDYLGTDLTKLEFRLCLCYPLRISGTYKAKEKATEVANTWSYENGFNGFTTDNKADALRHSLGTLLSAQYTYGNKEKRLWWAKLITDAHEIGCESYYFSEEELIDAVNNEADSEKKSEIVYLQKAHEMDLHNNSVGLDLYSKNTRMGWLLFFVVHSLSDEEYINLLEEKAINSNKFSEIKDIANYSNTQLVHFL
ncbi:MAG: hypothetical protein EOL97_11540 [Spirochaetia bacterium]|nr:hypothetical protein [Spirochaetia bacterium]